MSEFPSGMGGNPEWLSDRTRRLIAESEARERVQAQRDEREAAARHEALHERAVQSYRAAAEHRGEDVDAMSLALGGGGRTIGELLESARAQSAMEDAKVAAREQRLGEGVRPVVLVDEPTIIMPSPEKRKLLNRSRRWMEWHERKAAAERARLALEEENRLYFSPVRVPERDSWDSRRSDGPGRHVSFR